MNAKPQEFPFTEPFNVDFKPATKTKNTILINNGMLTGEARVSNGHLQHLQYSANVHENNLKGKTQQPETTLQIGNLIINSTT